jgi:integrase
VPHALRHTCGTRLGESGADAFTIMKLMGHSTVTVSQQYLHPTPEFVERALDRFCMLEDGVSLAGTPTVEGPKPELAL